MKGSTEVRDALNRADGLFKVGSFVSAGREYAKILGLLDLCEPTTWDEMALVKNTLGFATDRLNDCRQKIGLDAL